MNQTTTQAAKPAPPMGLKTWLHFYDNVLRVSPDFALKPGTERIQWPTGDYGRADAGTGHVGLASCTKDYLLARIAEELLTARPSRDIVRELLSLNHNRMMGPSEEMSDWLDAAFDVATRRRD